jgi:hypothetical protein
MKKLLTKITLPAAVILGAFAFIGGTGLMISSGWSPWHRRILQY